MRRLTVSGELLLLKQLRLVGIEMLEGMHVGATGTGRDSAHQGGGVHLLASAGDAHVGELMRHAAAWRAGLAGVVDHAGRHGVARHSWMLLHATWVACKARVHARHHL